MASGNGKIGMAVEKPWMQEAVREQGAMCLFPWVSRPMLIIVTGKILEFSWHCLSELSWTVLTASGGQRWIMMDDDSRGGADGASACLVGLHENERTHLIWDSFADVCRHTREETPDGYVKMLLWMMLQFFIPTDFSQVCFSKMGKNIHHSVVVYHPIFNPCVIHTLCRGRFIQIKSLFHFY